MVQDIPGQISIVFDAWTSDTSDPYLRVTAHYIHLDANQPNEWKLWSKVLGYTEIRGNHSSANTAAVILRVVDQYGIRHKVCTMCAYQLSKVLTLILHSLAGVHQTMQLPMTEPCVYSSVFWITSQIEDGLPPSTMASKILAWLVIDKYW